MAFGHGHRPEEGRSRRSLAPWIVGGAGLAALGLGVARWQLQRLFAKEPPHELEELRGDLEIRRYAPIAIARTTVEGAWEDALDAGFSRLAHFIFRGNAEKKKIRMTSPVMGMREGTGYRFAFVMPEAVDTPSPTDDRVALDRVPARRVAVLRFNGRYDSASVEAKKRELVATAEENGYVTRGEATFAGYDPPSTLPMLRRNEVWVEIEG